MNISRRQLLRGRVSLDELSPSQLKPEMIDQNQEKELAISGECLAFNQVSCRSCQDVCEVQAIRFQLQIGKPAFPSIDNDQCNACGECLSICPSKAISFVAKDANHKASEFADKNRVDEIVAAKGAQP